MLLPLSLGESALSGTNQIIKPGQVLFKFGDQSDGMYIVRRGEVCVYLEKEGKEVVLAKIGAGGMIGEMSLFDQQPRSASVKAKTEAEVTRISQDDFTKLMKQIPKWFVGLMSALSSRLRATNERLTQLERGGTSATLQAASNDNPYATAIRQLHIIVLLLHKDGEKVGKDWILRVAMIEQVMDQVFGEDISKLNKLLEILVSSELVQPRQDNYKKPVIAVANRTSLTGVANFIKEFCKNNPNHPYLTYDVISMLRVAQRLVASAPYESVSVGLDELIKDAKKNNIDTSNWEKELETLANSGEVVKVVKTSNGMGIKERKADMPTFVQHCQVLADLYKARLI